MSHAPPEVLELTNVKELNIENSKALFSQHYDTYELAIIGYQLYTCTPNQNLPTATLTEHSNMISLGTTATIEHWPSFSQLHLQIKQIFLQMLDPIPEHRPSSSKVAAFFAELAKPIKTVFKSNPMLQVHFSLPCFSI